VSAGIPRLELLPVAVLARDTALAGDIGRAPQDEQRGAGQGATFFCTLAAIVTTEEASAPGRNLTGLADLSGLSAP